MNSSQVPAKFGVVWGSSASPSFIQAVPDAYSGTAGSASLALGWGPETFQDPSTGGTAPLGEYENGIWNQATANLQWIQAGGIFTFDAGFSAKIGGYPKGAIVASATYSTFWKSIIENNTTDPDTGTLLIPATGWSVLQPGTYPWSQITGAPNFVISTAFTGGNQSLAVNGYQKIPGGLIEQWCEVTSGPSTIVTISYPFTFPTTCFTPRVSATNPSATSGGANNFVGVTVKSFTTSSCQVAVGAINVGSTTKILLDVRGY